jgi:Na+/proline symporter
MDKSLTTFASIMLFYAILSCVLGPVIFYFLWKKSLKTAGYGFIAGSILSILLWLSYGKKMV